jgi:hypothetical protein
MKAVALAAYITFSASLIVSVAAATEAAINRQAVEAFAAQVQEVRP